MSAMEEKVALLNSKRKKVLAGGGEKRVEKQHASGKKTARERITLLLDPGSFVELDQFVAHRCTNFGQEKKDLPGEILTVANEYLGTVRKYVPFGEATDNGYHVPYCLYEMMRDRKFLSIKTRKGPKGQTIVEQQMVREFALEILPPLTEAELARLSAAQLSAGGVE